MHPKPRIKMHKGKETGVWKTKIHFFGSIYVRFLQLNLSTLTGTLAIVHTFLRQHVSMREFIFYFLKDRQMPGCQILSDSYRTC